MNTRQRKSPTLLLDFVLLLGGHYGGYFHLIHIFAFSKSPIPTSIVIESININGFKGLNKIHIEDCSNINVFVGKNNSGKTSILEAIKLFEIGLRGKKLDSPKEQHINELINNPDLFKIKMHYKNGSLLQLTANSDYNAVHDSTPDLSNQAHGLKCLYYKPSQIKHIRTNINPSTVIKQIHSGMLNNYDMVDLLYTLQFYSVRNEKKYVSAIYKQMIDDIIEHFPFLESIRSDKDEKDNNMLEYNEFGRNLNILCSGTGLVQLLDMFVKILISRANVVLIDEPDNGLHPSLQRTFIGFLNKISKAKDIQFFITTHSPVILNNYDSIKCFRVLNKSGKREVLHVHQDAMHSLIGDLGIRPSDFYSCDICIMVEGSNDVHFFEHLFNTIYSDIFSKIEIGVQYYRGSEIDQILSGNLSISHLTSAQQYVLWIHDRDSKPKDEPCKKIKKLKDFIETSGNGMSFHILEKRELEYCYPEKVVIAFARGDTDKGSKLAEILHGDQSDKFRNLAKEVGVDIPRGRALKQLLQEHFKEKDKVDTSINDIINDILIPWRNEILGL
ncbi:ATP-dependent endonuclease [Planctomycetota bacterium]